MENTHYLTFMLHQFESVAESKYYTIAQSSRKKHGYLAPICTLANVFFLFEEYRKLIIIHKLMQAMMLKGRDQCLRIMRLLL